MMNYLTVLAAAALLLGACTKGLGWEEEQNGNQGGQGDGQNTPDIPTTGELVLTADKTDVEIGGVDFAQLTVTKGGVEVPASMYKVYEAIDGKTVEIKCSEGKYMPESMGFHEIKVFFRTEVSNTIRFRAKRQSTPSGVDPGPAPDDNSNKLNFKRRVLMIQFTGTNCGYCPSMINTLNSMMQEPSISENAILVAAHTYNENDPAFLQQNLDGALGVSGYPTLNFDMYANSSVHGSVSYNADLFNKALSRVKVRGGISAVSLYDSATRTVTVSAKVKAAEERDFRIGAMLIEDNIVASQANNGAPGNWTNFVHNNSIRYCDGEYAVSDYTGYSLGKIAVGETADYTFAIKLKQDWKAEDCRLVIYITTPEIINNSSRMYPVNNAITLPLTGEKGFEYTE